MQQQASALAGVHMFWHGPPLSRIERLCMSSFVANGHTVQLHVYEEPQHVPAGVTLCDASQVLPRDALFVHRESGSLAVFADWFRYRLLAERGGLWVDTDVVCLRPFTHAGPEIFGWQDQSTINNAVLGLPPDHALARWMVACCERPNRVLPYDSRRMRRRKLTRRLLGRGRAASTWGETGPAGLTAAARHLGCESHAVPFWHFYPIHYLNWRTVFDTGLRDNPALTDGSYALHLWNEMARREPGFDRNGRFPAGSLFERLWARYVTSDN
ncbi:MAG TPA: glycosyltransferase [Steroidobacteraceae bacterium]|nr:glycosyltransferase [Steroidobacteraceae bacterium]